MFFLRQSAHQLFVNFESFLFLYHKFQLKKSKFLKNEKKKPSDNIILHTLRCLINVEVKTNVEVRDFS